jgi:hypothetical protein
MQYIKNPWFVLAVFSVVLFAVVQIGCGYAVKWAVEGIETVPVTYVEAPQGVLIGEAVEYPPCDVEGLVYISGWCTK